MIPANQHAPDLSSQAQPDAPRALPHRSGVLHPPACSTLGLHTPSRPGPKLQARGTLRAPDPHPPHLWLLHLFPKHESTLHSAPPSLPPPSCSPQLPPSPHPSPHSRSDGDSPTHSPSTAFGGKNDKCRASHQGPDIKQQPAFPLFPSQFRRPQADNPSWDIYQAPCQPLSQPPRPVCPPLPPSPPRETSLPPNPPGPGAPVVHSHNTLCSSEVLAPVGFKFFFFLFFWFNIYLPTRR